VAPALTQLPRCRYQQPALDHGPSKLTNLPSPAPRFSVGVALFAASPEPPEAVAARRFRMGLGVPARVRSGQARTGHTLARYGTGGGAVRALRDCGRHHPEGSHVIA